MVITDIKIRKVFDDSPMKAIVSVTFDNQLAVHDIKVINTKDKLFIVMPSRKNPEGTYRDIVHPISADFRALVEKAVIEAYEAKLAEEDFSPINLQEAIEKTRRDLEIAYAGFDNAIEKIDRQKKFEDQLINAFDQRFI